MPDNSGNNDIESKKQSKASQEMGSVDEIENKEEGDSE